MKYTIIHVRPIGWGVNRLNSVLVARVETDDLKNLLKEKGYDVQFVFEGWPKLEGEQDNAKATMS